MRKSKSDTTKNSKFNAHTSEEITALSEAAADGRFPDKWRTSGDPHTGQLARLYRPKNAPHYIALVPLYDEGESLGALDALVCVQDADFTFALFYVLGVLAPPSTLPENRFAGGWIDLDDVAERIGWSPKKRSLAEREEMRHRLWNYLVFAARASVRGQRTRGVYKDRHTGEDISTEVHNSIWSIVNREDRSETDEEMAPGSRQLVLPETTEKAPLRVQIIINKEWEPLLTSANLAQYLPMAEVLASIPSNKVSGDWARSIGLALIRHWRIHLQKTSEGCAPVTRLELLTRYTPKTRTVTELLESDKPHRAVEYWADALVLLEKTGIIAAPEPNIKMRPEGYKWQEEWLNESVNLLPGSEMAQQIAAMASMLFAPKPKALSKPLNTQRKTKT